MPHENTLYFRVAQDGHRVKLYLHRLHLDVCSVTSIRELHSKSESADTLACMLLDRRRVLWRSPCKGVETKPSPHAKTVQCGKSRLD
jgi:hypothetical protein